MFPSTHLSALAAIAILATFNSGPSTSIAPTVLPVLGESGDGGTGDCQINGPTTRCEAQPGQYNSVFPGQNYVWSLPVNTAGAFLCGPNGQQTVCVDTTQGGSFTLQLNYVLASGPKVCTYVVTVNDAIDIADLGAAQSVCEGEDVVFSTSVLAGNGPYTYSWTFDDGSGPVPIPGETTDTLTLLGVTAADAGEYCVNATGQCGTDQACADLTVNQCGGSEFCTLTQGAYGSAGGAGNLAQINQLLSTDLVVGKPGRSLTIQAGSGACVILRLPGNSGPKVLPDFGDAILSSSTCQTSPTALPLQNDKFKNVLLGQTITLSLNTRLDTNLSGLGICGTIVTGDAAGGTKTVHVPADVITALGSLGLPVTVGGLLELANRGLARQRTDVASLSEINDAVSAINEGFDECRELIDCF